jgi:hypothetical protein
MIPAIQGAANRIGRRSQIYHGVTVAIGSVCADCWVVGSVLGVRLAARIATYSGVFVLDLAQALPAAGGVFQRRQPAWSEAVSGGLLEPEAA